MSFNPSIDVNSWKMIQWSADVPKLDNQLTELMLKLSTWCASANQALGTGLSIPLADTGQNGLLRKASGNTTDFLDGTNNWHSLSAAVGALFVWTPFTLTVTPGAGAITTQSSNAAYLNIGKLVCIHFQVSIANIGTASGATNFGGLPLAVLRGATFYVRENNVNGLGYSWGVGAGATSGGVFTTANAAPAWVNNISYSGQGVYQTS